MSKLAFDTIETNVEFACVHDPVNKYEAVEKEYKVTLVMDDKEKSELLKIFKKYNIKEKVVNPSTAEVVDRIKKGDDGKHRLTIKRNAVNKQGKPANIAVEDASGKPIPSAIKIGNGSRAVVEFFITTNPKTEQGSMKLSGLQVLDLVTYQLPSRFKKRKGFSIDDLEVDESAAENDDGSVF